MTLDAGFWLTQFLNGLANAMVLFLIASGLTILLGVLGVLNLAHGSFYMLGAFLIFSSSVIENPGWFWMGLLLAPLVVAGFGALIEAFCLRPLHHRERLYTLLLTYGFTLILDDLVLLIWGRDYKSVPIPALFEGRILIGDFSYPVYFLFIIAVGPSLGVFLLFILHRTNFGKLVRAAATDSEMLDALGVSVNRVFTGVFALGVWLASLGGILAAPMRSVEPGMGVEIIIESFIVVIVGGMGSYLGAFVGAVLIGMLKAFGIEILQNFSMIFIYALVLPILILRPRGLFGETTI